MSIAGLSSEWDARPDRIRISIDIAKVFIALNGGAVLALLTYWGNDKGMIDGRFAALAIMAFNFGLYSAGMGLAAACLRTTMSANSNPVSLMNRNLTYLRLACLSYRACSSP